MSSRKSNFNRRLWKSLSKLARWTMRAKATCRSLHHSKTELKGRNITNSGLRLALLQFSDIYWWTSVGSTRLSIDYSMLWCWWKLLHFDLWVTSSAHQCRTLEHRCSWESYCRRTISWMPANLSHRWKLELWTWLVTHTLKKSDKSE